MWIEVTRVWVDHEAARHERPTLINTDHIRRIEVKGDHTTIYWPARGFMTIEVAESYEHVVDLITNTNQGDK